MWKLTYFDSLQKQNKRIYWAFVTHPLFILFLTDLIVYGFFIPLLGFYWDDFNFVWLFDQAGIVGLSKYFLTDGPVMGLFYQLNFLLLGEKPWKWQAFSLFWRWVSAAGAYFVVRQLWRNSKEPAFMVALIILLFPGFSQQYIAICYGHFYIILGALFFSLGISLYTVKHKKHHIYLTILAILLAVINLASSEYFFMLEVLRPFLIWVGSSDLQLNTKQRINMIIRTCSPFLLVFLSAIAWRGFFFTAQTDTYTFKILAELFTSPFRTMGVLIQTIFKDITWSVITSWKLVFNFPPIKYFGLKLTAFYAIIILILVFLFTLTIYSQGKMNNEFNKKQRFQKSLSIICIGLIGCLLAGIPFWTTGINLTSGFPNDRFILPFMFGSGLIITGIFFLLPFRPHMRRILFILILSLAGGLQARIGISYKTDWDVLQRFIWQLTWRIPSIENDTVVFTNELPLKYFSDLSITAPLNLTYQTNHTANNIPYVLYYPTVRKSDPFADTLDPDQIIIHGLWIGSFIGNSNHSITLDFNPPACLRIIDPEIESESSLLPKYLTETSYLSSQQFSRILPAPIHQPFNALFKMEPKNNWCFSFEQADLFRQQHKWQNEVQIADQVLSGKPQTEDAVEYYVYIEGYANMNYWQKSVDLTKLAIQSKKFDAQSLCKLWKRIDLETLPSNEKADAQLLVNEKLSCFSN